IEEVADRWDDFVANDREEVPPLHFPLGAIVGFEVELRHREAVAEAVGRVPPRHVAGARTVETRRGGEEIITAEEIIDVAADKPLAVIGRGGAIDSEPFLIELALIAVGERHRTVEIVGSVASVAQDAAIEPPGDRNVAVLQPAAVPETAMDFLVFAFQGATVVDSDQRVAFVFPEPVARVAAIARIAAAAGAAACGTARIAAGLRAAAVGLDASAWVAGCRGTLGGRRRGSALSLAGWGRLGDFLCFWVRVKSRGHGSHFTTRRRGLSAFDSGHR